MRCTTVDRRIKLLNPIFGVLYGQPLKWFGRELSAQKSESESESTTGCAAAPEGEPATAEADTLDT